MLSIMLNIPARSRRAGPSHDRELICNLKINSLPA
jgi:hypothetical protein